MDGDGQIVDTSELVVERHEFTADPDTAERLAGAYVRFAHTRLPAIMVMAALSMIGAALTAVLFESWLAVLLVFAYGAAGAWVGYVVQRARLARQFRAIAAEGRRMAAEARPDALWLRTALSEAIVDYGAFERLVVSGDAVLLKTRNGNSYTVLPAALFPDQTLRLVRNRIDAATSS